MLSRFSPDELRSADRLFASVWQELADALFTGKVKAWGLDQDGHLEQVKNRGVWSSQRYKAFYTGYITESFPESMKRFRILIEKESLAQWLRAEPHKPGGPRALPSKVAEGVVAAFLERPKEYRLTKEATCRFVINVLGEANMMISKNQFEKALWPHINPVGPGVTRDRGPPKRTDKADFEADRKRLKAAILNAVPPKVAAQPK